MRKYFRPMVRMYSAKSSCTRLLRFLAGFRSDDRLPWWRNRGADAKRSCALQRGHGTAPKAMMVRVAWLLEGTGAVPHVGREKHQAPPRPAERSSGWDQLSS